MQPFPPPRKASFAFDEGKTDTAQQDTDDSEGPTELIAARWVIKETEEVDKDNTGNDIRTKTIEDEPTTTMSAPSPSLSKFEVFLEKQIDGHQLPQEKEALPQKETNDAFWERILQGEIKRMEDDNNSRTVPVE